LQQHDQSDSSTLSLGDHVGNADSNLACNMSRSQSPE